MGRSPFLPSGCGVSSRQRFKCAQHGHPRRQASQDGLLPCCLCGCGQAGHPSPAGNRRLCAGIRVSSSFSIFRFCARSYNDPDAAVRRPRALRTEHAALIRTDWNRAQAFAEISAPARAKPNRSRASPLSLFRRSGDTTRMRYKSDHLTR